MKAESVMDVNTIIKEGYHEGHKPTRHLVVCEGGDVGVPTEGFTASRTVSLENYEFAKIDLLVELDGKEKGDILYKYARWVGREILGRELAHVSNQKRQSATLTLPKKFTLTCMRIWLSYTLTVNLGRCESAKIGVSMGRWVDFEEAMKLKPEQPLEEILSFIQTNLRDRIRAEVAETRDLDGATDLSDV